MTIKPWIHCSLTLVLATPVLAGGSRCEGDLESVLAAYAEARGGGALERQTALRIRSQQHEGKWNPTFDYRVMKPGYMLLVAVYDDGDVIIEGFDGEIAWEKWGESLKEVTGAARRGLQQGALSPVFLYGVHHSVELGFSLAYEGCEAIDDTLFHHLDVHSPFGTQMDYYLNAETYRLERSRTRRALHPTQDPTVITVEERWSDFRWVEGVLHPFAYEVWNADTGERLSWLEVESIEVDHEATRETFRMPEE